MHLAAVVAGFGVIILAATPLPGARTRPGVYLLSALGDPLRDFFTRYRSAAGLILALICLYRIPDFVLNIMNPFYLDLGYTLVEIAEIRKVFGVAMSMFGVFAGGLAVARYGLLRAMVIGALAGPLSNLLFIWLAMKHHSLWALFAAIGLDNIAGGFAGTCLIAICRASHRPGSPRLSTHSFHRSTRFQVACSRRNRGASSRAPRASQIAGEFFPVSRLLLRIKRPRISPLRSNARASRQRRWVPDTLSSSPIPR